VRGRDDNTCQVCGYKWESRMENGREGHKRLDVHHLEGLCGKLTRKYDSLDMAHKLITVCHKCHHNLHDNAKYGKHKKS
jgi:protein-arginine kinase activator protein McsA